MSTRKASVVRIVLIAAVVCALSGAAPAFAGLVSGTVYDITTQESLPGMRVRAFDLNDVWNGDTTTTLDATTTAADGSYSLDIPVTGALISYSDPGGVYRDMYIGNQGIPPQNSWGIRTDGNPEGVDAYLYPLTLLDAFKTVRLAGQTRYGTAIAISQGNFYAADTVVIASGEAFPDGLSASPLAGGYRAPLLLTPRAALPAAVSAEIQRLGATRIFVVGGTGAVSDTVLNQLKLLVPSPATNVRRISGANRYATSVAVAEYIYANFAAYTPGPFLVRGDAFPDALSASPYAYSQVRPILLIGQNSAPAELKTFVSNHPELGGDDSLAVFSTRYLVVGGEGAVSDAYALKDLASASPHVDTVPEPDETYIVYSRIAGNDRFGTSGELATFWGIPYDTIGIANGFNFPDALAGGAAAGYHNGALLLTPPTSLSASATHAIGDNSEYLWPVQVYGGSSVVTTPTLVQASVLADTPKFDHDDYYSAVDPPWFGAGMAASALLRLGTAPTVSDLAREAAATGAVLPAPPADVAATVVRER